MDAMAEAERAQREDGPVKFLPAFTKHPAKYPPMKESYVSAKFHIAKEVSKDDFASWFEDMINRLYLIERQLIIAHATSEEIRKRRQQKDVTDILTSLWCEAQRLLKQKKPRYGEMMKAALNYLCNPCPSIPSSRLASSPVLWSRTI